MTDYQQKEMLLSQLSKWWTANGWRLDTLKQKGISELLRIRARAQACKWAVTTHRRRV